MSESAFIEGRHMFHSVLIANEAMEEVRRNAKLFDIQRGL